MFHPHKPKTRREFLSQGLIGFSAMATLPGLFGLGARRAFADCGGSIMDALPMMVFDMAGGAALPGNFLVGKEGDPRNYLERYDKLGWNPRASGALFDDFGLPMARNASKILEGILASASAPARANLRMGSICHFAQDDASSNQLNSAALVLRSGVSGRYISHGLGIINSTSGGNSDVAMADLALKPTFVQSLDDINGATSFGGSSLATMPRNQLIALAQGAIGLGGLQAQVLGQGSSQGATLAELAKCAYDKSAEFVNGISGLDPRADDITAGVYNINTGTLPTDANAIAAGLVMNVLRGNSGPSVWTLGGCDYHDRIQASGDGQDRLMGVQIGLAIELAYQMKKPFFFQLLTDGGCEADPGTRNWGLDSGDKCMTVVGYYHPDAPPEMTRQQVGYYTDGQSAERSTLVGSSPALVAHAVLANYMAVSGTLEQFHDVAPGVFNDPAELRSVLLFKEKS